MKRLVWGGLLAALALLLLPVAADAHSLAKASVPEDGGSLDRPPAQVTITFTEAPDPRLSIIHVLNTSGQSVEKGTAQPVPGDPTQLRVGVANLPNGVYTVNWRTVSAVDGHVAGGAFAFGIGVSADEVQAAPAGTAAPTTPPPSVLGVGGRWILYAGLALLVGGLWVGLFAFRGVPTPLLIMASVGAGVGLAGLAALGESQRSGAGVDWATFLGTRLGANYKQQVFPLLAAALVVGLSWLLRGRLRVAAAGLAGLLAAVAMVTHVMASHAPGSQLPVLMVTAQWAHLAGFSVWIGGLAGLLLGVRGLASTDKSRAVRRFSRIAGLALAVVTVSGALRAIDEIGAWSKLANTLFGQLVVLKILLLMVLAALGAVNRWVNVPLAWTSLGGLRRVGGAELSIAAVVVVAASILTSLEPPSFVKASAAPLIREVTTDGTDYGTTVRAHLAVVPGYAGPNRFTLSLIDADSHKPVSAKVQLRFLIPARSDVGESALDLQTSKPGIYSARGSNLSLVGDWRLTVVAQQANDSVEVPLGVRVESRPQRVVEVKAAGQPTVYVVDLASGDKLQAYIQPGREGANELHLTYVDSTGQELALSNLPEISARGPNSAISDLSIKRFSSGHFIAQGFLRQGKWSFDVSEPGPDSGAIQGRFEAEIGR